MNWSPHTILVCGESTVPRKAFLFWVGPPSFASGLLARPSKLKGEIVNALDRSFGLVVPKLVDRLGQIFLREVTQLIAC